MIYKANIDIMYGDMWNTTVRGVTINNLFKGWFDELLSHILSVRPYLMRRKEFDLYWECGNQTMWRTRKENVNCKM